MVPLLATLAALSVCASDAPRLTVQIDPRTREVVMRTAPVELPAARGSGGYADGHHGGPVSRLAPFAWPVDGWARGFTLRVLECDGRPVSRAGLHHAVILHLERRELNYPIYQRLVAFGQETGDIVLPSTVGIRMSAGDSLGLYAAWMPVAEGPTRVVLEVRAPYLPANINPRPTEVVPVGFDVHYRPGGGAGFDLPPGVSVHERVFEMPLDGRILVAGGHLHDYAESIVLIDERSGKRVIDITPRTTAAGRLEEIPRKVYGAMGRGVKLSGGRPYRLVVRYRNPTGRPIDRGGMGILVGLFEPEPKQAWPALDRSAEGFALDVAMLVRSGLMADPGSR